MTHNSSQSPSTFNILTFFITLKSFSSVNSNIKQAKCKIGSSWTVFCKHYFISLVYVSNCHCKAFNFGWWSFFKPSTQSPMQKWIFNYSIKKLRKSRFQNFMFLSNFSCFFKDFLPNTLSKIVALCKFLPKEFFSVSLFKGLILF